MRAYGIPRDSSYACPDKGDIRAFGLPGCAGNLDHAGTGAAIVRRVADADDVEALFRLWQSHVTIAEFMASAEDDRGLCPESKALIRRAHRRGHAA